MRQGFVTNRVGDFSLLLGILVFFITGSVINAQTFTIKIKSVNNIFHQI